MNAQNLLYNASIGFTNDNIVAISDGGDCLKLMLMQERVKVFTLNGAEPGIILDVQYVKATSTIVIATCSIKSTDEKKFTKLLLLTYSWRNAEDSYESFELIEKEGLKVKGTVEYVYIEESGKYLHSICQDHIAFECPKVQESADSKNDSERAEIKIPRYCWSQDEDSLTVWITIQKKDQNKVKVHVTALELSVTVNDKVLVQGQCQHTLDKNLTTWKYEQDVFKLELSKYESGLMWSELIKGDTGGECLPNETLATEIHSRYIIKI